MHCEWPLFVSWFSLRASIITRPLPASFFQKIHDFPEVLFCLLEDRQHTVAMHHLRTSGHRIRNFCRRLRCNAPGLWDNLSRSTAGLGSSPTSIFAGPAPCKNFGVWPHPNCLPKRATRNMAQKTEVTLSFTFPPFLSMLSSLGL